MKIDNLIKLLTAACVILAGHSEAARAQTLFFSPDPVAFTISGPGAAAGPTTVTVSSTTPVSAVSVAGITTSDRTNWLCAVVNGFNSINVYIGSGSCSTAATTNQLTNNTSYNGEVTVQGNGGQLIGRFGVTLHVGNGATSGPVASPTSVAFTESAPGQATPASQVISVTANGAPVAVTGSTFTPNPANGPNFINVTFNNGNAIFVVNSNVTTPGTYLGTVTLITNAGNVNVPIALTFGGSGGLGVTPNSLTFNVQSGGNAPPQNVTITSNASLASITSVTSSASWLLPSFQSGAAGNVSVGVNAAGLSAGMYNGTVTVNTAQGTVSFQVNLTVAGIPTLNVNPTALNFAYQVGTNNPLSQSINVSSNGAPTSFSVISTTSSGGGQWLVVTPSGQAATPTALSVSVNPAGLPAGPTYQGNIQINTFGGSTNSVINIPVSLLVTNNPVLAASPTALSFTVAAGAANPPSQTYQLSSSSTALSYTISSSVITPAGSGWLQVPTQSGTTTGTVTVLINAQGLTPGTYSGTVTATSQAAGNPPVTVPVTLTVTAGAALQLNPASLSFAYQTGQAQPPTQGVTVASNSGQPVTYSVATQTNSGQAWLNVSANSGTTPGNFAVGVNTSGLAAGTYDGSVTVTPNVSNSVAQTIPVRLVVSNTALLVVSPASLAFSIPFGSTSSSFQNVAVTSTDGTPINFNVAPSTTTGSNWLLASASSGTTASNLTFSANPSGLAIGTYTGMVTITATSPATVADSPQTIAVTLNITPTAALAASSTSLSFAQATNGGAPAPQTLTVSATGAPITFAANATLFQGVNWLTVSPTSATASPGSPAALTITANGTGLAPGVYNGQIALTSPGAANTVLVNISLTVSTPPTITVIPSSLTPVSYQIGGANPAAQTIAVSIAGGGAVPFSASATMQSGANWLLVSPATGTTPANVTVTLNPAGLAAGTYQGAVLITVAGAANSPFSLPITLTVTPAPVIVPVITAIQNNASYSPTSLAPGLNLIIYGMNMGPGTLVSFSGFQVPKILAGTQVTFDGIPAPVIFTSSVVASVMVPYGIAGRVSSAMVVSYNGVPSAPLQLRVVDAAPGFYTINNMGTGQGAILNENGTINSPGNPESVGHFIQLFGTGEGQTSPQGVDGLISANQLPLPVPLLPVSVTIGGKEVPASDIIYAGEAPSIVSGVIQIDAKIPDGVGPGPVPVVFRIGGVPSQANVTVSVR